MKAINSNPSLRLLSGFLIENFVWVLVVLLSIIAWIINPVFYSANNIYNLLMNSVLLGILVLAESLVLLTGNFDMSLEVTLSFTAIIAAWLTMNHRYASGLQLPAFWGIVIMLALGAGIGAINGYCVGYVKMQPFITTFAVSVVFLGLSIFMTGGSVMSPFPEGFTYLGRGMIGKLPVAGLFLIGLYIAFYVILRYTHFGRKLFVIGGNIEAAKALGVNVSSTIMFTYIISGLIAACGGWIHGGRLSMAASHMSTNQLFLAFGAAVMGGVRTGGGQARVSGMFGGVLLLASINTLMNLSKIDPYVIQAASGAIILIAMLIDALKSGAFLTARN